jgi:hypothetical protein
MKERETDLFQTILEEGVDAVCVTTNGQYRRNGIACMGGGCAGRCAERWPQTAENLGEKLRIFGSNVPFVIGAVNNDGHYIEPTRDMIGRCEFKCLIFNFPTINQIVRGSNLQLIKQSATVLKDYVERFKLKNIMIGIDGTGWVEIKAALDPILDDRFTIVFFNCEGYHEAENH